MPSTRELAVNIARALLEGNINSIEGSRKLAGLRHELDMSNDSSFLIFAAIDSDTDEWPAGHSRQHYSKNLLVEKDGEVQEYIEQVKPEMLKACEEIIEKLS